MSRQFSPRVGLRFVMKSPCPLRIKSNILAESSFEFSGRLKSPPMIIGRLNLASQTRQLSSASKKISKLPFGERYTETTSNDLSVSMTPVISILSSEQKSPKLMSLVLSEGLT